jgi:hypothetical protein
VNDDNVAIGGDVYVEFEGVHADLHRLTKRLQRVFWSVRCVPSMPDEGTCVDVEKWMHHRSKS